MSGLLKYLMIPRIKIGKNTIKIKSPIVSIRYSVSARSYTTPLIFLAGVYDEIMNKNPHSEANPPMMIWA